MLLPPMKTLSLMFLPTAKSKEPERVTDARVNRGELISDFSMVRIMSCTGVVVKMLKLLKC